MGSSILVKTISKNASTYSVYKQGGYPYAASASETYIEEKRILSGNVSPVYDEKHPTENTRLTYGKDPYIIVFYSIKAPTIEDDISLFLKSYQKTLNSKYVLGCFSHTSIETETKITLMSRLTSFSVALFDKTQDEIIEFAASYIHATNRAGAYIVGKGVNSCIFSIYRQDYEDYLKVHVFFQN